MRAEYTDAVRAVRDVAHLVLESCLDWCSDNPGLEEDVRIACNETVIDDLTDADVVEIALAESVSIVVNIEGRFSEVEDDVFKMAVTASMTRYEVKTVFEVRLERHACNSLIDVSQDYPRREGKARAMLSSIAKSLNDRL